MPYKDKNKEKEWKKKNIEKIRQWRRDWYRKNPEKRKKMDREQRLKFPWKKHYDHAKQRCTNPNHDRYSSYGAKGIKFDLTLQEVKELYIRDNAFEMKQPSIDRINTYGDYTFDNCRFIEFEVNNKRRKRQTGRRSILQFDKKERFIKEYVGVSQASRETLINKSNISQALSGKQKTAGGFIWRYKDGS